MPASDTARPDISVVIQTYNHAPFIQQCLDSVVSQRTDYRLEILVGEDGSTDGTAEIVNEFARRHPTRLRVFHRSRADVIYLMGRPTGRFNLLRTIEGASGRYIAILDGDDYYTDQSKLDRQARFLDDHPDFSACFHDFSWVDSAGKPYKSSSALRRHDIGLGDVAVGCGFHASTFLSRNDFRVPTWFKRLPYSDWPLLLLRAGGGRLGYINREMAAYRTHDDGVFTSAAEVQRLLSDRRTAVIVRKNWEDGEIARWVADREFRCLVRLAREYRRLGRRRAGQVAFAMAGMLLYQGVCHVTPRNARRFVVEKIMQLASRTNKGQRGGDGATRPA